MKKLLTNAAFIDGVNLYKARRDLGWQVDTEKLITHLRETYDVGRAYYFVGFVSYNQGLYNRLETEGYEMVYKETYYVNGRLKGNIDSELVLKCMTQYRAYKEAILITSDGDFACLAKYLISKNKLRAVIATTKDKCSHLLEQASGSHICYADALEKKLSL